MPLPESLVAVLPCRDSAVQSHPDPAGRTAPRPRAERRCRWRRLDPSRQALLVLAHLRNGDTYARLAAGFAIGTSTAWRYVREAAALHSSRQAVGECRERAGTRVDRPEDGPTG
ncbi:hypothetical protein GCM10010404_91880 [Nonomuraea africana]